MSTDLQQFGRCLAESFRELLAFRREFENRTFSTDDELAKQLALFWDPNFVPNFEVRDSRIRCRQDRFFTLLPFAAAVSEFLIGIEELAAYEILEQQDHDQFANFVTYNSCFHFVDSFLCSAGTYFIPTPIGECVWQVERNAVDERIVTRWPHGVPTYVLRPSPLKVNGRMPRYLIARWDSSSGSATDWSFSIENGPIHASRWKCFGDKLKTLIKEEGVECIPDRIQQFFRLFAGHLIQLGVVGPEDAPSLNKLIEFTCSNSNFNGIKSKPLIPNLRHLAIYRNQSTDEHLRLIAHFLDPTIISPSKFYGKCFDRLAKALAKWQNERLGAILASTQESLPTDVFLNGMRSALHFSGLVELDFAKIVDSDLFSDIPVYIRNVVGSLFRRRNLLPGRVLGPVWKVGNAPDYPIIHTFRYPPTIHLALTPRSSWRHRIQT